jgi:GNAT superfamily N-acetyltransferase
MTLPMAEGETRADGVELTDRPDEGDLATISAGLAAYNRTFIGPREARPLLVTVRRDGRIAGGLSAVTVRGMLEIDLLWVDEAWRGQGLGSRLLRAAEAEAAQRGCRAVSVGTFDFQARPFYERAGYTVAGEVGGYPDGHRWFMLTKALTPAPARAT